MKRWQKSVLWIAIAGIALLVLAFAALHALLDPKNLTQVAEQQVRQSLGRALVVDGLSVHLLPLPSVRASSVALANPAWAENRELVLAKNMVARLDLLPLLSRRLSVRSLDVDGVTLHLESNDKGERSWDFGDGARMLDLKKFGGLSVAQLHLVWAQSGHKPQTWDASQVQLGMEPGWRNTSIRAQLQRNQQTLTLHARIADLSRYGKPDATSEGDIRLQGKKLAMKLAGTLPLHTDLNGTAVNVAVDAESLAEAKLFFGWDQPVPIVPLQLTARVQQQKKIQTVSDARLAIGATQFTGEGKIDVHGKRPLVTARINTQALNWADFTRDLGLPVPPAKPETELLPIRPLPWPLLMKLQNIDGEIETRIDRLTLRGGTQLQQWRAHVKPAATGISLQRIQFALFGGTVKAALQMEPLKKSARLQLSADKLSLQTWSAQRKRHAGMLTNGPMDIEATLSASGDSLKSMAATLTGPVTIHVGEMRLRSSKAQEAENLLVNLLPALSAKNSDQVQLRCASVWLPFSQGQAASQFALGMRSDVSNLMLAGLVDLRAQAIDLRGRVKANSGASLGISTLAGDVRVSGRLNQPQISLDPPGALARVGAAIATTGLSIVATAIYDAVTADQNPCALVDQNARKSGAPAAKPARKGGGKATPTTVGSAAD